MFELIEFTDMTTSAALHTSEERRGRQETRALDIPRPDREETSSLAYFSELPSLRKFRDGTPTAAELAEVLKTRSFQVAPLDDDDIERARRARVSLMARKYEGATSLEDEARIDILTERLRRLSPRVTETDLETMSKMVDHLEGVSSNLEQIRTKFGLK